MALPVALPILAIVSYIFYMIQLHPLAAFPGPLHAKLTKLDALWHAVRGTRHRHLQSLHNKYGDFVRVGPNQVSINHPGAIEDIYGIRANAHVQKSAWYSVFVPALFSMIDKDTHARLKRIMSHAFSDQSLRETQPHIIQTIDLWLKKLGEGTEEPRAWSEPKDMQQWIGYVVFDSLGEMLFGSSFETITSQQNRWYIPTLSEAIYGRNIAGYFPMLDKIQFFGKLEGSKKQKRAEIIAFAVGMLRKRLAMGLQSGRRDLVHFLKSGRDPKTGESLSPQEIVAEAISLTGAGLETTHTALCSTWYYLLHDPETLVRLASSIRSEYTAIVQIQYDSKLKGNKYLRACVDEALRLCPPVPQMPLREVLPGGINVLGQYIPAGTVIGVPFYALFHDEAIFPDPYAFRPARWLSAEDGGDGLSDEVIARQREALVPFSTGPRGCIGKNLALMEVYVGLARALFRYDFRLAPGTERVGRGVNGEYHFKDYFTACAKEGPIVQLRARTAL